MLKRLIFVVVIAMMVGACKSSNISQAAPAAPTDTQASATEAPTASPIPPTATQAPTGTPVLTPTITTTVAAAYGPESYPAGINPLTGLQVSDPALLERRPLSVKVQIFPRGQRPPWGVSLADVVYDYYQNNGMTRFHAIFYGNNAQQVGPIRSGRLFDSNVVTMYKSILAFGGADRRIMSQFLKSKFADRLVMEGSGRCPPMCRIDPNGFNYLVTDTSELSKYAAAKGIDNTRQHLEGMSFNSAAPAGGQSGLQLSVRYSISAYNRWVYDVNTGRYLRFQDIQEDNAGGQNEIYDVLIDGLTGQQIAADNIVVLMLPHKILGNSGEGEIVDIEINGNGLAYAFREGQIYEVRWNRPDPGSVLYLTFPDGSNYPLKPGNTWFQVIGKSSTVQPVEAGAWRFVSSIP